MGIAADMAMSGSVSGGCVETAVVQEALDSMDDRRPRLLHFGVSDETAWDVGLACGGKMSVYVEPLDRAWWDCAAQSVQQHRAATTVVVIDGPLAGQKVMVDAQAGEIYATPGLSPEQRAAFAEAAKPVRKTERAAVAGTDTLIDVLRPSPRLIIVGGAHVAMTLQRLAQLIGFRVALIDPRQVFATPERFPDAELISHDYPDKAFAQLGLDSETYVAVLTHDPKIDDPALAAALAVNVPYIGVLSSKRAHEKRLERLAARGVDPALFGRIHTPIGLDIGAKAPEEIALAILAEVVAVRNGARA